MAIDVSEHPDGCVIAVRAQPGARRNGIVGEHAGMLKIAVTAPPDKGRANDAIVGVLAAQFGLKASQVEFVSGMKSKEKRFLLRSVTIEDVQSRLSSLLNI